MEVKNPPIIIGDLGWEDFRGLLIAQFCNCKKEEDLIKILSNLLAGFGTLNQIKKNRKRLGIKPLTKEEIKRLNEQ